MLDCSSVSVDCTGNLCFVLADSLSGIILADSSFIFWQLWKHFLFCSHTWTLSLTLLPVDCSGSSTWATLKIRYDTIRDAILTCARKPTWVSLIYCTEPTTKKCKNRKKTKSRKQICSEITVNSPGNPRSEYLRRRKERLQWEGFAEKEGYLAWNERVSLIDRLTTSHAVSRCIRRL